MSDAALYSIISGFILFAVTFSLVMFNWRKPVVGLVVGPLVVILVHVLLLSYFGYKLDLDPKVIGEVRAKWLVIAFSLPLACLIVATAITVRPWNKLTRNRIFGSIPNFFLFSGRVARINYLVTQVSVALFFSVFVFFGSFMLSLGEATAHLVGMILILVSSAFYVWLISAVSAKRARDCGISPWWALTLLVPPVNFAASVFLLFVPSDEFRGRGL